MADTFPNDLINAQLRLHQARAEYVALCHTLPWSVDPMDGWPGAVHPHTGEVTGGRAPSTGYTDEQKADVARLEELLRELSAEVTTHPHWATVEAGKRMQARMDLKTHPEAVPAVAVAA
ncbi:hypothetical protein ACFVZW_19255 [Streptomyces sp. NPDC059567]|uniref:hypothetical protein n=1 Tax=Streptomyces sp. NPDC059567 TaxID=3346867 RepID=UPI0036C77A90